MPLELLPEERQAIIDINFVEWYESFCLVIQYPIEEKEALGKSIWVAEVKK